MSKRRDWDKVAREDRFYMGRELGPADWSPIEFAYPKTSACIAAKPNRESSHTPTKQRQRPSRIDDPLDEWTLMTLDYRAVGGKTLTLQVGEIHFDVAKYYCIDIPEAVRVALMEKHMGGLVVNFDRQIPRFFSELSKIAVLRRYGLRGSILAVEFEFSPEKFEKQRRRSSASQFRSVSARGQ